MAMGIDGYATDIVAPQLGSSEGPGAYDQLLKALRELREHPAILAVLAEAWQHREFHSLYARPLLVLASLRYRALSSPDHPLGFELLMDAVSPDIESRLLESFKDPELVSVLREHDVLTNESGRAFAWGLPAMVLGFAHRGFHLLELGAVAGLCSVVDRTAIPFSFGANKVAGFDFPSPEHRLALDPTPVDIRNPDLARWLEACIWAGQPERLQRLKEPRDRLSRPWQGDAPSPRLEACATLDELRTHLAWLAEQEGPKLVFDTYARVLSKEEREARDLILQDFLRGETDRLYTAIHPRPIPSPSTPLQLSVALYRDDELHTFALADSGYHSSSCLIAPGAISKLRALWHVG